jgi:hypothetical protein
VPEALEIVFGAAIAVVALAAFALMIWASQRMDRGTRVVRR